MKKYLIVLLILVFTSCTQRGCQRFERTLQFSDRIYIIEQYSGGKLIKTIKFRGILNNEEGSDGYFFIKDDTLYELSGEFIIKSVN